ncbi:MAG: 2,3-bisphosphoglycerate-independent phosphoglycerate mutase [Phycisphaerales bacterium]|jgi:2,3-bisphosphoglycerate-independent phosphoglycerate mutase
MIRNPDKASDADASISKPVVLVIRDGWGENPHPEHDAFNAVRLAQTPVADRLAAEWPTTLIATSGEDVGLPSGASGPVMGNSEVGHQNLGAGRIVDQELMRITNAIRDGGFSQNSVLRSALERSRTGSGRVHLLGLVSDGQVHSDLDHLLALLELAAEMGCPAGRVFVHVITDGRDTAPTSGLEFVGRLERHLEDLGVGAVASVMGRYWAMDRDHRWDRVARAWRCLVGPPEATEASAEDAIENAYVHPEQPTQKGDEFVPPTAIVPEDRPEMLEDGRIRDGDAVVFFNFRGDRPRELVKAFVLDDDAWSKVPGGGFERTNRPGDLLFTTFTEYETGLPVEVVFPKPPRMSGILGAVVSDAGRTQFRCAETEKFPHVTFFFNDYREEPFPGERREIVPSPRDVATYDLKPEMSAEGVCRAVLDRIASPDCEDLIVVNFANPDMVGHTGDLAATIEAVEIVDACVGRLVEATLARGGALVVTADHGNAEQMKDPESGRAHTAHTNFTVPLVVVGEAFRDSELRDDGRLADIAPTLLEMMGLPQPPEMTGRSLLI